MRTPPISLHAQAEQSANEDHTRRLAELKALAPLLARLDAFVQPLAERKLQIRLQSLHLHTAWIGGKTRKTRKYLRIDTMGILDRSLSRRWLDALLALGFREVERTGGEYQYGTITLRHGAHLVVVVDRPEAHTAPAPATQAAPVVPAPAPTVFA